MYTPTFGVYSRKPEEGNRWGFTQPKVVQIVHWPDSGRQLSLNREVLKGTNGYGITIMQGNKSVIRIPHCRKKKKRNHQLNDLAWIP